MNNIVAKRFGCNDYAAQQILRRQEMGFLDDPSPEAIERTHRENRLDAAIFRAIVKDPLDKAQIRTYYKARLALQNPERAEDILTGTQ